MSGNASIYQQLRSHLAYLKLAAVAEQLPAALERAAKDKPGYTQFLHDLLDTEVQATEERRLAGRMRFAGFPSTKTLEQFDFTAQPSIDRKLVGPPPVPWTRFELRVTTVGQGPDGRR